MSSRNRARSSRLRSSVMSTIAATPAEMTPRESRIGAELTRTKLRLPSGRSI